MLEFLSTPYPEIKAFLLALVRVGALLLVFPFYNERAVPALLKAGLALLITLLVFPLVETAGIQFPGTLIGMVILVTGELIFGMTIGLLVHVFFEGVRMMGQLVGFQTGFAIANVIDPQSGIQISIFSNVAYFVALILFLTLNGHHILLQAVRDSFEIIPVGAFRLAPKSLLANMSRYGDLFVIAIKMGAPAIAVLLLTKVAFGLITKLIPQMNIMIVAFPVQIVIGLLFFGISLSILGVVTERTIGGLDDLVLATMRMVTR